MSKWTVEMKRDYERGWRKEGRSKEVAAFRETVRKECRLRGLKSDEATDAAWDAALKAFPPLTGEEIAELARKRGEREATLVAKLEAGKGGVGESAEPIIREESFPWDDLPGNANPKDEADWVYANYERIVTAQVGGKVVVHWRRALAPPPSVGTRTLLRYALGNFNAFMRDLWLKFQLAGDDPAEPEAVRRERVEIGEIERVLGELEEAR